MVYLLLVQINKIIYLEYLVPAGEYRPHGVRLPATVSQHPTSSPPGDDVNCETVVPEAMPPITTNTQLQVPYSDTNS